MKEVLKCGVCWDEIKKPKGNFARINLMENEKEY